MSLSSTDKGLLTPDNCAVIFIDHQPQMFFGVANIDRQDLLNNVLVLAKAVKIFHVPVILTAIESEEFCGNITPQLLDLFPNQTPIERSSLNAWENKELAAAVKSTARNNFLSAALWSETRGTFHGSGQILAFAGGQAARSEEHTPELQSLTNQLCR